MSEKILINDDRLTPTMARVRDGSTMVFYTNPKRTEELAIKIVAPSRELKAELIDGVWYWVNDCDECNGRPPKWTYMKCLAHDVCVDCKKPRSELTDTPWGTAEGFRCKPCQTTKDAKFKADALARVASKDYDEFDYQYKDEITCPHCASTCHQDSPHSVDSMECDVCHGKFSLEVEFSVDYSTKVIGERVLA